MTNPEEGIKIKFSDRKKPRRFSALKAIRYKCLDCVAGSWLEVKKCNEKDCSLWEFRFGKNPTMEMATEVKDVPVSGRDENLYIPVRRITC